MDKCTDRSCHSGALRGLAAARVAWPWRSTQDLRITLLHTLKTEDTLLCRAGRICSQLCTAATAKLQTNKRRHLKMTADRAGSAAR